MRILYDEAIDGIHATLLKRSSPSRSLYVAQHVGGKLLKQFEHLSCFLPAILVLGADGSTAQRDLQTAMELVETCFDMYACFGAKLSPEMVEFVDGRDFVAKDVRFLMRPEVVEFLFYLFRKTKADKYREYGWKIFEAISTHCRTDVGFSGISDIFSSETPLPKDDIQQAYFLSETLKYLFLLFSEDDLLPLDRYIFNTEAHPLGIWL